MRGLHLWGCGSGLRLCCHCGFEKWEILGRIDRVAIGSLVSGL